MNVEKEIKILLSEVEYNKLIDLFEWSKDYVQVNHYYGSDVDIKKKINTYRVREKNGKYSLQIKIPEQYDNSLHVKKEYEKDIDSVPNILKKEILSEMIRTPILEDKNYIGKLITMRKECHKFKDVEVCLDKNIYLNKTDFEIEIEFIGDYPENVVSILKKNGITTNNVVEGKYTRYLKEFMVNLRQ